MNFKQPAEPALEETIRVLANRWSSAGPLLAGFPLLAEGKPASVEAIAAAAGVEITQVDEAVDAARCERDAEGRLVDLYGLTLTPTRHRLEVGRKVVFACCALWAYVVPRLVDTTVALESVDPVRQELVRLSISPTGLESADSPAAAASLVTASQEAVDQDVGSAFCSQVCFFVSLESAEEFARERPTCHAVGLQEFGRAAESFYQAIWSAMDA